MILVVTGGRDFMDVPRLWQRLDGLNNNLFITTLVEGGSDDVTGPYVGADFWSRMWAMARGIGRHTEHAEWKRHGKAAGPIRNGVMLERFRPKLVLACPGGRGTADMVKQAKAAGVQVVDL